MKLFWRLIVALRSRSIDADWYDIQFGKFQGYRRQIGGEWYEYGTAIENCDFTLWTTNPNEIINFGRSRLYVLLDVENHYGIRAIKNVGSRTTIEKN